ncbi:proline/glycine betaine ABC transporter permease [Mariniluteicoccus endophyticus]
MNFDPLNPSFPIGEAIADGIDWLTDHLGGLFDAIQTSLVFLHEGFSALLSAPPYWVVILVLAAIAWWASSWRLALFTAIGFYMIRGVDLWNHSMQTISLVVLAVAAALVISVPLGILAAKSDVVSKILKPILDLMQTLPAMVYLVPTITIFSVGPTPGAIATLIFSMPPGVRLTELAIRQVDKELVEAGQAFGDTPGRILTRIQLPVAMPTIMAGVNQVIMLALSMVVIAGMAGAGGLGGDVTGALARLDTALGFDAGLAVVIIAVFLDRITSSLASGDRRRRRLRIRPATEADATDDAPSNDAPSNDGPSDKTTVAKTTAGATAAPSHD